MGCHKVTPALSAPTLPLSQKLHPGHSGCLSSRVGSGSNLLSSLSSGLPRPLQGPHIRLEGADQFPVPLLLPGRAPLAQAGLSSWGRCAQLVETPGWSQPWLGSGRLLLHPTNGSSTPRCARPCPTGTGVNRPKSLPSWGLALVRGWGGRVGTNN